VDKTGQSMAFLLTEQRAEQAAAQDTCVGIELMHMLKKKQLVVEAGDEGRTAAELFYSLAASSLRRQGYLSLHNLRSKICDITPQACAVVVTSHHPQRSGVARHKLDDAPRAIGQPGRVTLA
jgi:hypothetical protein